MGQRSTLSYQTSPSGGGVTDVADPLGGRTTFAFDGDGILTRLTDAEQNASASPKHWTYVNTYMASDPQKLESMTVTNPRGLITQVSFDTMGNATQVVDRGQDLTAPSVTIRSITSEYLPGSSDLARAADPEGNTSTRTWSGTTPVRLLSEQDPLGNTLRYTYSTDPAQPGWITATTDPKGNQTRYAYDRLGNVIEIARELTAAETLVQRMTYYPDGSVQDATELREAGGAAASFTHTDYDNLGRRTRVIYPDGSQEASLYDPAGKITMQVSRGGQSAFYQYDRAGRVSEVTDHVGNKTTYRYDAAGNATAITDANGHTTLMEYDRLHRAVRQEDPNGLVTLTSYDETGNAVAVTNGHRSEIATQGYTVTASYYLTDLLRQISEPLPAAAILLPDDTAPAGTTVLNTQSYEYNRAGKTTRVTDGNGKATEYLYDALMRAVKVIDAAGGVTEYAFDANGNQTDVWDAQRPRTSNGISTRYEYDAFNRVISIRDPLGNTVTQTYDSAGNLASKTEPRTAGALATRYEYDAGHRLTRTIYPNLTGKGPYSPTEYVYDGGGRRLARRDDSGIARYKYDELGRLIRVFSQQENSRFGYDAGNRMTTVTDPMGNVTRYSYDLFGHMSEVNLPGGLSRKVSYFTLPSGAVTNRVQRISNTKADGSVTYWAGDYQYDYAGNVRRVGAQQNQFPNAYTLSYSYDNLYRLTQWTDTSVSDGSLQNYFYAYDAVGNRLNWGNENSGGTISHVTPSGNTVTLKASYDSANRTIRKHTVLDNQIQLTPGNLTNQHQQRAQRKCRSRAVLLPR